MSIVLNNIKGKSVLFIGQVFYDYHAKILNELEELGAVVTFIPNKFHGEDNVPIFDLLGNIRNMLKPLSKKAYAKKVIRAIQGEKFDYVFCIGGFSITPYLILNIIKLNPSIIKIIYFWDSFQTWNYSHVLHLFDFAYSFDPLDAQHFERLNYLPLFYTNEYKPDPGISVDLDLLYIGSVSMISRDRLRILKKIEEYAIENGLKYFFWLYSAESGRSKLGNVQSYVKKIFISKFRDYINSVQNSECDFLKKKTLTRKEVTVLMNRTNCVLDIPIPNQLGLTIRSIETLAINKKLITMNNQIKSEPFYNEKFISVFDEEDIQFNLEFLKNTYDQEIDISHLELGNWLKVIFRSN